MEQLGNLDSLFVSLETSGAPQHVGCFGIYAPSVDGIVRFQDVLQHIECILAQFPNFRRRLMQVPGRIDRPYWVADDNFDIEFHVRHLSLPKPGDWRQLCIQIARLHAHSLDLTRPLWQCYLIEGLEYFPDCPDGSFALYVKMHHSLLEGDFGQRFIDALHDLQPQAVEVEADSHSGEATASSSSRSDSVLPPVWEGAQGVGKSLLQRVKSVLPVARTMAGTAWGVGDALWRIYRDELPAPQLGPSSRFDHPLGPRRVVEATLLARADVDAIRAIAQTSVHAVALAVIGGGLRRYLQYHDELPAQSMVAYLPVGGGGEGLLGRDTAVTTLMSRVHSDIDDPIERLQAVHDSIANAKRLSDTPLVDPLRMVSIVPPFMTRLMAHFYLDERMSAFRPAGTVIANMQSAEGEQYCLGARLVQRYWLGALSPAVGLFHTVYTLNDKISVAILADRIAMPDPAFYRECLEDAFFDLKAAAFAVRKR